MYMSFGLRNAAQTFQRFIDEVLHGLTQCYAYIDDILAASENEEQHEKHLEQLFTRLKKYGMRINPAKCVLGKERIKFLGYEVSATGTQPLSTKVEVIKNFRKPATIKQLRQFLGMINFYRRFIPGAAREQAILNDMLRGPKIKSKTKIDWSTEQELAFKECKDSLGRATELAHSNPKAELILTTNASDTAIGAVIEQIEQKGAQPLAFLSKKINPAQQKYSPYDRELLAIYVAIKHYRHLLEGRQFAVYTDHKPLVYAFNKNQLQSSLRQARHLEFISQFTTDIRHVKGKNNVVANALSRTEEIHRAINIEELAKMQDEELREIMRNKQLGIKLKKIPIPGTDKQILCDTDTGKPRPYVTQRFRRQIFTTIHGLAHPGIRATVKLITARYIWRDIKSNCAKTGHGHAYSAKERRSVDTTNHQQETS